MLKDSHTGVTPFISYIPRLQRFFKKERVHNNLERETRDTISNAAISSRFLVIMAPQTRLQARVTFSHPLSLRDLLKIFPQLLSYHIVPLIVLDCVALVFREEMGPFIDEVTREADHLHTMGFRHPKDCRRDLKSMSLVHRVWTVPAQRALRYRVVLTSSESTERFLTNQMCGPWIRELWIKIPEEAKNEPELEPEQVSDSDTDSSYEPSPEDDVI